MTNSTEEHDTHTQHCCKLHGCKYRDPNCNVTSGNKKQEYLCESCDYDKINNFVELEHFIKNPTEKYYIGYTNDEPERILFTWRDVLKTDYKYLDAFDEDGFVVMRYTYVNNKYVSYRKF